MQHNELKSFAFFVVGAAGAGDAVDGTSCSVPGDQMLGMLQSLRWQLHADIFWIRRKYIFT